ncbi:MAG: ABC transporter permease [Chitinivibrionia bacterium]|nr:ABC transporter permease [Chitinivibrionia bacterium]
MPSRKKVLEFLPGTAAFKRGGVSLIFSVFFYLCLLLLIARAGRFGAMLAGSAEGGKTAAAMILSVMCVLYFGATVAPALNRRFESRRSRFAKRFSANATAVAGTAGILAILLMAAFGPVIAPCDPDVQNGSAISQYQGPSPSHPMGTDKFGRDIFSRVLAGARISLGVAIAAVVIALSLGVLVGAAAGYAGGALDEFLMRFTDGLLAFPRLLLVLLLVAFFSSSYGMIVMVIACTSWMGIARLVRAEVMSIKGKEYMQAAVASGISRIRLVWRHLLPNALGPVIVAATLQSGSIILLESTLSFLGIGVQPPTPSWGNMVFEGREVLLSAWWVCAFPGLAIVAAVISLNLLGDGLRDAMEPREAGI